jgi:hypothetical protein
MNTANNSKKKILYRLRQFSNKPAFITRNLREIIKTLI